MAALLDIWSAWVAASLTESLALIAGVWICDRAMERRVWPEVRQALWLLVLVKLCLPPGIVPGFGLLSTPTDVSSAVAVSAATDRTAWPFWTWIAGVVATAWMWRVRSRRAAGRLNRAADDAAIAAAAQRVADEARAFPSRRRLVVRVDREATLPYVTGLVRPTLVLPGDWPTWTPATLSHAIGHELCHLSRRDLWLEGVWMVVAALYWFHPLVHVARRRAHAVRELCCDAHAARLFGPAYRGSLLHLAARATFGDRSTTLAMPQPHHSWGPVVSRLKALERWPARISLRRRVAGVAVSLIAAAAIVPSWTTPPAPPSTHGLDPAVLLDPVRRQEAGLGSMHVRYQLLRLSQQQGSDR
jgi:beta-lactamase regulating signal transducer with metallopeptidase domain